MISVDLTLPPYIAAGAVQSASWALPRVSDGQLIRPGFHDGSDEHAFVFGQVSTTTPTFFPVGNSGNGWPAALQSNQSTYHPRIVATDYIDLDAYVSNKAGYSQTILKDAVTAGGYPPAAVVWNDPAMKRCIATIHAQEPGATIHNPVTATASTSVTWTAPELACQQMALFSQFAKAAGKTLNNQTLGKGAASLGHVTIPGGGGTFDFVSGHGDGNGPVFVYQWSPAKNKLQLMTTAG